MRCSYLVLVGNTQPWWTLDGNWLYRKCLPDMVKCEMMWSSFWWRNCQCSLWTIDGVFYKQGLTLPTFVGKFVAYNCPETSKHRKRQRGNMSGRVLKSISQMYWDRENWRELKTDIEKVAQALANYASYLQTNCKKRPCSIRCVLHPFDSSPNIPISARMFCRY